MAGGHGELWRVPAADFLVFAAAGETILYSHGSGRTIYLDPAATVLFEILSAGPLPATALPCALAVRWQVDVDAVDPAAVTRMLETLLDGGVVERVAPCA